MPPDPKATIQQSRPKTQHIRDGNQLGPQAYGEEPWAAKPNIVWPDAAGAALRRSRRRRQWLVPCLRRLRLPLPESHAAREIEEQETKRAGGGATRDRRDQESRR